MADLPRTNKQLLAQTNERIQVFTQYYKANTFPLEVAYTNRNDYAVIVLITAQAGSGRIDNATHQPNNGDQYYVTGQTGRKLTIKRDNHTFITLNGGQGSQGGAHAASRSWRGSSRGWSGWSYYGNWKQVAQNGQNASFVITLPPNSTLKFIYGEQSDNLIHANNKQYYFTGYHQISVIY